MGNKKYYRAVTEHLGEQVTFEPTGFYEKIDKDGYPVFKYDIYVKSSVAETCASKFIGGAVMGSWSNHRTSAILHIYEINEEPDVDISDWTGGDFEHIQEVRYRKPVQGNYIGCTKLSDELIQDFSTFYEVISDDGYGCETDPKLIEFVKTKWESFSEILNSINCNILSTLEYNTL